MDMRQKLLNKYTARVERWQRHDLPVPEIKNMDTTAAMLMLQEINPTKKSSSIKLTKQLFEQMLSQEIFTTDELCTGLVCSKPPILARLQVCRKFNLIRRLSKIYYVVTPKFKYFMDNYQNLIGR